MMYFVLGVLSPIFLNLLHLVVGIYVVMKRGTVYSLGFTATGLLTKSVAMIFFTWLGVSYFELDFRIYVPILSFVWFFTHVVEALIIQHYIDDYAKKI